MFEPMKLIYLRHILIKAPVPSQECERSCIYVLGVSILPISTIRSIGFGTVPTVW
jgi:hypothetical protein